MGSILTGKSLMMVVAVVTVAAIMLLVFALLIYFGPSAIFDLFRGIMTAIALNLISSIHGILR
jgi:hypothetical protein